MKAAALVLLAACTVGQDSAPPEDNEGADIGHGDIWAINEFPTTTRTGELDIWPHERAAVKGLATGDGTLTVKGVVYTAGMGQTLQNVSVLKGNIENWLQQDGWWADMNKYVRWY